ncbi:hypothetical protein [Bifidobacterium tissieri]|uniref:hypothetical protein n=1 Tax=Bifidobacterium tissieri TaxID=1630162 RepID=UPI00123955C7|nr:hypothetical protein [Bifidobacterium tissieri]KAA8831822.1 hypothetical protein EM849_07380 [Bifidobacterium tissieri]
MYDELTDADWALIERMRQPHVRLCTGCGTPTDNLSGLCRTCLKRRRGQCVTCGTQIGNRIASGLCKPCYKRAYRSRHQLEDRQYKREWRHRNHERVLATARAWRERNRQRMREYQRRWREEHREELRTRAMAYYHAHRDEINRKRAERRKEQRCN